MKPKTKLPLVMVLKAEVVTENGIETLRDEKDMEYIAHAANAYPKLVETLRAAYDERVNMFDQRDKAATLLRELGELP